MVVSSHKGVYSITIVYHRWCRVIFLTLSSSTNLLYHHPICCIVILLAISSPYLLYRHPFDYYQFVIMPYKCCVFGCKTGYKGQSPIIEGEKNSLHSFPNDAELRRKWTRAIRRESFEPSKSSKVCSIHFTKDDFLTESADSNKWRQRSLKQR